MAFTYHGIYTHRPISENGDEIRILELLPGARSDPIRVALKHVPFHVDQQKLSAYDCYDDQGSGPAQGVPDSNAPRILIEEVKMGGSYEAVSYAWGSTLDRTAVAIVDGLDYWSLGVSCNCAGALRTLRYEDEPRTLWIDAICIDQGISVKALAERARQVMLMANIFKAAEMVIAWLGPSSSEDEIVARWIDEVSANVQVYENWYTTPVDIKSQWGDIRRTNIDERQIAALNAFIHRAWYAIDPKHQGFD